MISVPTCVDAQQCGAKPKVLVLLAAFNGAEWILEQVESILCQKAVDIHLIISDDGSTDGTRAKLDRLTGDKRIQIVSPEVPSRSAAQNFLWLIRRTAADQYDYVSLADQDDIWDQAKLARGCAALVESGAQCYSSAVTAFWSGGRTRLLAQIATVTKSDFLFEGAGQGCTYMLARPLYKKLRTFFVDHRSETQLLHYHDWAIYALARLWKEKWIFDQKSEVLYRQHRQNDTGARMSVKGILARLTRLRNGWYSQQLRIISRLCLVASPENKVVLEWNELLRQPRSIRRQRSVACFCLRGGRRRWYDNVVLLGSAVAGWI